MIVRFMQALGGFAALSLTVVMTVITAHVFYKYGSQDVLVVFYGLAVTEAQLFLAVGICFDLCVVGALYLAFHWYEHGYYAASASCTVTWLVCSAISFHSVDVFVEENITKSMNPAKVSKSLVSGYRKDLETRQGELTAKTGQLDAKRTELSDSQTSLAKYERELRSLPRKGYRATKARLKKNILDKQARIEKIEAVIAKSEKRIDKISEDIEFLRGKIEFKSSINKTSPIAGFAEYIAAIMWLLTSTLWYSFLGPKVRAKPKSNANNYGQRIAKKHLSARPGATPPQKKAAPRKSRKKKLTGPKQDHKPARALFDLFCADCLVRIKGHRDKSKRILGKGLYDVFITYCQLQHNVHFVGVDKRKFFEMMRAKYTESRPSGYIYFWVQYTDLGAQLTANKNVSEDEKASTA